MRAPRDCPGAPAPAAPKSRGPTRRALAAALLLLALAAPGLAAPGDPAPLAGLDPAEARRLGERMYREGILPSGEPMQAVVMGDVTVDGTMFTCQSCHLRSGLGSLEGTVVTLPTNGGHLYAPLRVEDVRRRPSSVQLRRPVWETLAAFRKGLLRPAYTDETLAVALRVGKDPVGRRFDPVMPRYLLGDRDMAILIDYLKNLSVIPSPGGDAATLRFATVITPDVPKEERWAYLTALRSYIEERSLAPGGCGGGAANQADLSRKYEDFARPLLAVWELEGPPESWRDQLERRYREAPVFAFVGGLSRGSWEPIHRFCEDHGIPCLFPVTDLPVVSASDWYTLYFSRGLSQEGEAAARYLSSAAGISTDPEVLQVYRRGGREEAAARGFEALWRARGRRLAEPLVLGPEEALAPDRWTELVARRSPEVVALWLSAEELARLPAPGAGASGPKIVFASSTLLDERFDAVPVPLRDVVFLTHPYLVPDAERDRMPFIERWLKLHGAPTTHMRVQAKAYFAGYMLFCALMEIRDDLYRDYFIESIDMMIDQSDPVASYPRLSFGPGQRYASKGCYVVQCSADPEPRLLLRSDWTVH